MKIARVFPRLTRATPEDELCFFGPPPMLTLPEIDEVHVSCVFTYDREKAEELAYQWEVVGAPVKIGGPAYDDPAEGDFVPGRYLKKGYVITSRGATIIVGFALRGGARGSCGNCRSRMGGMCWTTTFCNAPSSISGMYSTC